MTRTGAGMKRLGCRDNVCSRHVPELSQWMGFDRDRVSPRLGEEHSLMQRQWQGLYFDRDMMEGAGVETGQGFGRGRIHLK